MLPAGHGTSDDSKHALQRSTFNYTRLYKTVGKDLSFKLYPADWLRRTAPHRVILEEYLLRFASPYSFQGHRKVYT